MLLSLILIPLFGAVIGFLIGRKREEKAWLVACISTVLTFMLSVTSLFTGASAFTIPGAAGLGLKLKTDGFRQVYVLIIALMWMMTVFLSRDYFAGHEKLNRYFFFIQLTLSSTLGVFLSADLFTALVFFEVMSFASFPWVIQEETKAAVRAAETYLFVAVIGGLAALMGLYLLYSEFGTLDYAALRALTETSERTGRQYAAGALILVGFGAKAGMFPLHIWLPKAHPVAPAPASALLSGVLTKAGIFGIIVISSDLFFGDPAWGTLIVSLGTVTMFLGAVLALFSVDLKRTLACSSMSQIGFILIGIGSMCLLRHEASLAARGAFLHMINHSLFKLVLFMCAGVVYMNAHTLDLNRLRGFGRGKFVLQCAFFLAAAGIAGIPGLNGYLSKTLLHEGIVACSETYPLMKAAEWIFLCSGGLTLAYMTKLYVCLFVDAPSGEHTEKKPYMHALSYIALTGSAVLLPALGISPSVKADRIMDLGADFFNVTRLEEQIHYYALENLKGAGISILIGAAVYFFIVRKCLMKDGRYVDRWPAGLDLEDRVYRPLLLKILPGIFGSFAGLFGENRLLSPICRGVMKVTAWLTHAVSDLTDGLVYALRRTVFRERRARSSVKKYDLGSNIRTLVRATHDVMDNLSFALLMLCVAVSAVLIYILLIRNPM